MQVCRCKVTQLNSERCVFALATAVKHWGNSCPGNDCAGHQGCYYRRTAITRHPNTWYRQVSQSVFAC